MRCCAHVHGACVCVWACLRRLRVREWASVTLESIRVLHGGGCMAFHTHKHAHARKTHSHTNHPHT